MSLSITARHIGHLGTRALLHEAAVLPKPGLVCPDTPGAHKDMDFSTLVSSALSLGPYFAEAAALGFAEASAPAHSVFAQLRVLGKGAEETMLVTTGGVNTHRGLVFSLGILACATARNAALSLPLDCASVCTTGAALVRGIVAQDFALLAPLRQGPGGAQHTVQAVEEEARARLGRNLSAGERLFVLYGSTGVRGEAESGFSHVAMGKGVFDRWRGKLDFNAAAVQALLALMAASPDTNVLHRGGPAALERMQGAASRALHAGGISTPQGRQALDDLCALCLRERLSPGGCADMLALVIYFHFLEGAL